MVPLHCDSTVQQIHTFDEHFQRNPLRAAGSLGDKFGAIKCPDLSPRSHFTSLPLLMAYGNINGMELRIDKAGRIVVPKPLRERLGFKPDTELEAIEQPEGVLLKRVQQRPSMVKVDGLWVHQGSAEPGANWERILEDVREERIASVLKA